MIRKSSGPGSWTSLGSFKSSTYVQPVLFDLLLIASFQTELALNTHTIVSGMQQSMLKDSENTGGKGEAVSDIHTLPTIE